MHRLPQFRSIAAAMACVAMSVNLAACAVYTPLNRDGLMAPGETRIELTERGTLELAPKIGAAVVAVDGRVRTVSDSTVEIALIQTVTRNGDSQQWVGELIAVPLGYVNTFKRRQPSLKRSLLLGGGIAAGVVAAAAIFGLANSGSGGNLGTGGTAK